MPILLRLGCCYVALVEPGVAFFLSILLSSSPWKQAFSETPRRVSSAAPSAPLLSRSCRSLSSHLFEIAVGVPFRTELPAHSLDVAVAFDFHSAPGAFLCKQSHCVTSLDCSDVPVPFECAHETGVSQGVLFSVFCLEFSTALALSSPNLLGPTSSFVLSDWLPLR